MEDSNVFAYAVIIATLPPFTLLCLCPICAERVCNFFLELNRGNSCVRTFALGTFAAIAVSAGSILLVSAGFFIFGTPNAESELFPYAVAASIFSLIAGISGCFSGCCLTVSTCTRIRDCANE